MARHSAGSAAENFPALLHDQRPTAGNGLGLNIVQRLVKEGNGALHVRTQVGAGTTFTVYLPARIWGNNSTSDFLKAAVNANAMRWEFFPASFHQSNDVHQIAQMHPVLSRNEVSFILTKASSESRRNVSVSSDSKHLALALYNQAELFRRQKRYEPRRVPSHFRHPETYLCSPHDDK